MSLPRSFRQQSWFVRFPTGEIDVVDGATVARGLECGTLGYDTPVCAVGTQVWLPLRVHASTEPGTAFASMPSGDELAVAPLEGPWRVRHHAAPSLAVKKGPLFGALAFGALTLVAAAVYVSSWFEARGARAIASIPKPAQLVATMVPPSTIAEETRPAPRKPELTSEQRRRLLGQDRRVIAQSKDLQHNRPNDWARLHSKRPSPLR